MDAANPFAEPLEDYSPSEDDPEELADQQSYVNRLLSRGAVFAIFWVFGLGSFYSLYLAWKAHRIVRGSRGRLYGLASVWFCYLLGGLGASLFVGVLTVIFIKATSV